MDQIISTAMVCVTMIIVIKMLINFMGDKVL